MTLNKTKIEWCDYSWSPLTGCLHNCSYCYARKIATRFEGSKAWPNGFNPTFHPERLEDPLKLKTPSCIFTCSMSDLFGKWNDPDNVVSILDAMAATRQHTFICLTKAPENIDSFIYGPPLFYLGGGDYLGNVWLGTTVEDMSKMHRAETLLRSADCFHKFISFEPLLGRIEDLPVVETVYGEQKPEWIIIGAQTNPLKLPKAEDVVHLLELAYTEHIPVFIKDNLRDNLLHPIDKIKIFTQGDEFGWGWNGNGDRINIRNHPIQGWEKHARRFS